MNLFSMVEEYFFVLNVKKGTLPTFFLALPTIFYVKK